MAVRRAGHGARGSGKLASARMDHGVSSPGKQDTGGATKARARSVRVWTARGDSCGRFVLASCLIMCLISTLSARCRMCVSAVAPRGPRVILESSWGTKYVLK